VGQNRAVATGSRFPSVSRSVIASLSAVAVVGLILAGCGGGHHGSGTSADPAVLRARADVDRPLSPRAFRGPANGPGAQPHGVVVFVAADLSNGGIAGVGRGVQQAARAIGWRFRVIDGGATAAGERRALRAALRLEPAGIILGGFDATEQRPAMRDARARGIPVVGWHAGLRAGPDRKAGLFTNVTTDPAIVARLAARYVIADSGGRAAAVIFTDSQYSIATYKADQMAAELKKCRGCRVLAVINTPIATAQIRAPAIITSLLQRFGDRFRYLLAINGAYVAGARTALLGVGRAADQPPFSVTAGDGDASEFARIRAADYQKATVAEPLYLQGWQLIDELNRARTGQPASGYVAPPRLITQQDVPSGGVFDPPSGYRENYLRIWRG